MTPKADRYDEPAMGLKGGLAGCAPNRVRWQTMAALLQPTPGRTSERFARSKRVSDI